MGNITPPKTLGLGQTLLVEVFLGTKDVVQGANNFLFQISTTFK